MSKQLSTLLRHGHLPREDDGAIEFWRLKDYHRNEFERSQHWSDEKWKSAMALDAISLILHLQDNVLIPNDFFKYIYHTGYAINLHSIMNSELTPGEQNLSKRHAVFFTSVDPMNKKHKDPDEINLNAPRLVWYKHKVWKKHQNIMYWVDIKLAQKKGFKFYQTRSNAIILYDTLPAYCIPKAIKMKSGEVIYERVYASPLPLPKISLKTIG